MRAEFTTIQFYRFARHQCRIAHRQRIKQLRVRLYEPDFYRVTVECAKSLDRLIVVRPGLLPCVDTDDAALPQPCAARPLGRVELSLQAIDEIFRHDLATHAAFEGRIVDVMEELAKFTVMTRGRSAMLTDRYSERVETLEDVHLRVSR